MEYKIGYPGVSHWSGDSGTVGHVGATTGNVSRKGVGLKWFMAI